MGDMSDLILDFALSNEDYNDAFAEDGGQSPFGYYNPPSPPSKKTCRYCGKTKLEWSRTKNGFRLTQYGVIHNCNKYRRI